MNHGASYLDPPPSPTELFSRAFYAPISPPREHVSGIRFENPIDLVQLAKQRDSPRELDESVQSGMTSATQDSAESEVVHILRKIVPISPSLSDDSVRTKLLPQKSFSGRLFPVYYPLLVNQAVVVMRIPANLIIPNTMGTVRIRQKVCFTAPGQPWKSAKELIKMINDLRHSRGHPDLSEDEESVVYDGVASSLYSSLKTILEKAGKDRGVSLYSYLRPLSKPLTVSLLFPAYYINDDPNCEFVNRVEFRLPSDTDSLDTCVDHVSSQLAEAIDELRTKNDLPTMDLKLRTRLMNEIRSVLLIKVLFWRKFHLVWASS